MKKMMKNLGLIALIGILLVACLAFTACDQRPVEEEPVQKIHPFMEKEASGAATVYHRIGFSHPDFMSEEDKEATPLPTAVMLPVGSSLYDAPIPEREGYVFEGWYYDSEMTKPVSESDILTENTILYPHMIPSDIHPFVLE